MAMRTNPLDLQHAQESLLVIEDVAKTLREAIAWMDANGDELQVFNLPTFQLSIEKLGKCEAAIRSSLRKACAGKPLTADTIKLRAVITPANQTRKPLPKIRGVSVTSASDLAAAEARAADDEASFADASKKTSPKKPGKAKTKSTAEIKKQNRESQPLTKRRSRGAG